MKKLIVLIYGVLFCAQSFSQELTLMTYNIRLDVASDGENAWANRKEMLVSQLQFSAPDIFGIQEGLPHQVTYIDEQLAKYGFIGEGRDGQNKGEYSALYFNESKIKVIHNGTFWLSETPNIVSMGWDAAFPRICTYGLFENKVSGIQFWVFNTHLDHIGVLARKNGLELILEKIKSLNEENLPFFLMGDFNLEPTSEAIAILKNEMNDSREVSNEIANGPEGTFNAFNYESEATQRIDYIFVSKSQEIEVQKYAVLNNSNQLKLPSDHFPVFIQIMLK